MGVESASRGRRIDVRRFVLRLLSLPFFHANGRPRRWLRKALFRSDDTPRRYVRFLVQHSNGRPRRPFRRWYEEAERRRVGADLAKAPRLWFFMGDSLDWLSSRAHVTGVGRVTLELFAAGLDGKRSPLWYPALAGGQSGLRNWRRSADADRAAAPPLRALRELLNEVPSPPANPKSGDHVLFTGVVWNAHYVKLFRQVTKAGIGFSVLVHDIIPILDPSASPPQQRAEFIQWMEEVARNAENIYVSSPSVRADIEAWTAAQGIKRAAPIIIPFGPSLTATVETAPRALRPEVTEPFVLSVGTIDRRKNQVFLVRVWRRLLDEIGAAKLPMLVLVGRDDLGLAKSDDAVALRAAGRLAVLSDVMDEELDRLYCACLFTAFPSTMEGYGLPVADSLAYGKVVVASALGPIRDHAGELPLYFDPANEDEACRVLSHVIEHPEAREAREKLIAARPVSSWQDAADAVYRPLASHFVPKDRISRLLPSLSLGIAREELVERARPWFEGAAPKVSILILNWNAATLTRTCIEHIWAHTTGVTYEIIVADNGSARSDLATLRDLGPGVRLLPLGVNRFFGEANNIMAEHATGELICLLNNDVFVSPGWLERLVAELEDHPEAGAVGPVFLFPDNTVQEAGGTLDSTGIPGRGLRGEPAATLEGLEAHEVDYVSAAALVMKRNTFFDAGGFDLAYEPAYYEDTDLCFKLAALGKTIRLFPAVTVIHLEGYSTDENALPSARKKALGDLNRGKFLSRWGAYLKERSPAELAKVRAQFTTGRSASTLDDASGQRAVIYTPFDLTPGGGERYLLTLAASLTDRYKVTIATPHPYSALRLRTLGGLFDIDLSPCAIATEAELDALPTFELMVTMGNHIVPPVPGRGVMNFYHCQFPFPMPRDEPYHPGYLDDYLAILVNSSFTRDEVLRQLERLHLPSMAVEVFYPPVPQYQGEAGAKKPIILSVGRFFVGGHAKRQDLMIKAFARLHAQLGGGVELHLAGSSLPSAEHLNYLRELHEMAEGLPVVFHVNCSAEELQELYRDAAIYWHATGLGADVVRHPELAEHFGIAIVEAMSAGCVCFALNAGGAREIIFDGENGFLYDNETELVAKTAKVIAAAEERARIGESARARAAIYDPRQFAEELAELIP